MKNMLESLLVFSVMTGILLPARILFVAYVSDDWLGSLGIISAISISMIILAKKKKLGSFGPMFERQIHKFQKGKRGIVVFAESLFLLFILGGMIFAINQGNSVYSEINLGSLGDVPADDVNQILEPTKDWNLFDWLTAFLMIPVAFLTAFPEMSATIASIDQKLDGWLMHFYTVGFVEYLELLGILLFYRVYFNKKSNSPILQPIYSRAAI